MSNNNYFSSFHELAEKRAVEATVSILGITNPKLRSHLIQQFKDTENGNSFLADPTFETMFAWKSGEVTMEQLSGKLLKPSLIQSMDAGGFSKKLRPFEHQLTAWKALLNEKKSIVVTSGTGSGKTECFMVPILNDLATEYEKSNKALVGVRALFIYPLNALINSQRERLRDWTRTYDDGLRFCLYNGNTQENKHKDQGKYPNEILTRKILRDTPAPILVTNATMLEYMLVRQLDAPIIDQSKGKLRWIVLDEAHSYLGSQAAELSLLLRRVLHTFGVKPEDVRFVATSATIGDGNAAASLQTYLANLAGISVEQVKVIGGKRSLPSLLTKDVGENRDISELLAIDSGNEYSASRYEALNRTSQAITLRQKLSESAVPLRLSTLATHLYGSDSHSKDTLAWIDVCSSTSVPGPKEKNPSQDSIPFLPLRGHFLHQVVSGLWCCVNKNCSSKRGSDLEEDWPFGFVYTKRLSQCDCGAPIFELVFCNECNAPHLLAAQRSGRVVQLDRNGVDEFSLVHEGLESGEEDNESGVSTFEKLIIASRSHPDNTWDVSIDSNGNIATPGMDTFDLAALSPTEVSCVDCEYAPRNREFYRRALLGTPFYISNAMPALLEACSESGNPTELPNRGRRLITFTDSRQGTARISSKLQQDSERESIRSLVYRQCADSVFSLPEAELEEKSSKLSIADQGIQTLKNSGQLDLAEILSPTAEKLRQEIAGQGKATVISWNDMLNKLQLSQDLSRWMFDYYHGLNPQLFSNSGGARVLAELLLLREFARRPKRYNSLETLGLVSVRYPALEAIQAAPSDWLQLDLDLNDWRAFLKTILDFYIRENTIIDIPQEWIDWIGIKIYPKTVIRLDSEESTSSRVMRWPKVNNGKQGRIVRLLAASCELNFDDRRDVDIANSIMKSAWNALTSRYTVMDEKTNQFHERRLLRNIDGSVTYALCREEIAFQVCSEAWICPVTHRLLDNTFKGYTPYLPISANKLPMKCEKVVIPECKVDAAQQTSEAQRKAAIRAWIYQNASIGKLRQQNLWTDVSDKILEGSNFFRVAEHSAQQPASKLEQYEALFKLGKLNILSCSTTMEMGVDIGGISVVAMNNVPPHPANYLQRAGRAGRRGETQALAFSICKDNPHERGVFNNPQWPFITTIPAPYISLNSERIVQRHVNSLLVATFLKDILKVTETQVTSLSCEWFFYSEIVNESPVELMLRWLESLQLVTIPSELKSGILQVIKGSALAGIAIQEVVRRSIGALQNARNSWLPSFLKLKEQLDGLANVGEKDPYRRKVAFDLRSLGRDYLLSELAARAYLPGYGFPSGVVTFDHYSVSDFKSGQLVTKAGRIDNRTRLRERPARDLPTALREYAPGADVFLDGRCYRSAGILLNKFAPNESFTEPQRMLVEWRCHKCGTIGSESGALFEGACSGCGTTLMQDNIKEFIEPEGFAVEFYSSPTIDVNSQAYIPVQEPWVSAGSGLESLFNQRLGSYRTSAQGHIFHHSSGEFGTGFAVCLRCGRAGSMTLDGEYPADLQPGIGHVRLQGKPGPEHSARCEGVDEAYAIKKLVHLGTTSQTDVFELNLKHPNANTYIRHAVNDPLPWTLAVVLRQALADIQGINAEEMGYLVKPTALSDCSFPVASVVLYDKNAGGAGFASSAVRYLPEMIKRTLIYLDCPEGCQSSCQACLLGYDTRFHSELMDRHLAIKFVHSLLPYLEIPNEAQIFGKSTQACFEPFGAELISAANRGANTILIVTRGDYENWGFGASEFKSTFLNLTRNFENVQLVLPSADLGKLSEEHKEDLLALGKFGIEICHLGRSSIGHLPIDNVLAQVISDDTVTTFGTNGLARNQPGPNWWQLDECFLVESHTINVLPSSEIDLQALRVQPQPGDVEIELTGECDGSVASFGTKLWDEVLKNSPSLAKKFATSAKLGRVMYSDCYISSPWTLMLLGEMLDKLRNVVGKQWDNTKFSLVTQDIPSRPSSNGYYSEWSDIQQKNDVYSAYINDMGISSKIHLKKINEIPHGRVMKLTWRDGSTATVRFDHGVGCWSMDGKPKGWFDIQADTETQVSKIYAAAANLKVRFGKQFPTQIFVKVR